MFIIKFIQALFNKYSALKGHSVLRGFSKSSTKPRRNVQCSVYKSASATLRAIVKLCWSHVLQMSSVLRCSIYTLCCEWRKMTHIGPDPRLDTSPGMKSRFLSTLSVIFPSTLLECYTLLYLSEINHSPHSNSLNVTDVLFSRSLSST